MHRKITVIVLAVLLLIVLPFSALGSRIGQYPKAKRQTGNFWMRITEQR